MTVLSPQVTLKLLVPATGSTRHSFPPIIFEKTPPRAAGLSSAARAGTTIDPINTAAANPHCHRIVHLPLSLLVLLRVSHAASDRPRAMVHPKVVAVV